MAKASDNEFPSILVTEQASKPTAPASGDQRIYMKTDHKLYHEDSGGAETEVGGSGIGVDGWVAAGTFTYASSTTVAVASDATTVYSVGNKVRWKGKYFCRWSNY